MFEVVGLLIGIVLLFVLSRVVGVLYAAAASLILRSQHQRLSRIAMYLPTAFAAYMLVCAIVFSFVPGQEELLFGGIAERLPNGYILKALGKMPEHGTIEAASTMTAAPALKGWFGSLAVDGPLVFGAYESRDDGGPNGGSAGYFSFDRSGKVLDFATIDDLNRYAGHPVRLIENQYFQSPEPSERHLVSGERAICFTPPAIVTLLYFLWLLGVRSWKSGGPVAAGSP